MTINEIYTEQLKKLGRYTDEVVAAKAYDNKAIELYGKYANLNFTSHEKI